MIKKFVVILLMIFPAYLVFADKNEPDPQSQIKNLQEELEKHKTYNKEMSAVYENRLKNAEKEYLIKTEDFKVDIKKQINTTWFSILALIIGGLGGLISLFFIIPKFTHKKITDEISELISINRMDFLTVVQQNKYTKELKDQKKIVVIASKTESNNDLQHFLTHPRFGFKNLTFHTVEEQNITKICEQSDLVILNNQENDFKLCTNLITNEGKAFFLYFNVTNERANVTSTKRFNFANSTSTLYARIIETLETQDIL